MQIEVFRKYKKDTYTIGKMFINGAYFCDTLEDKVRVLGANGEGKVKGQTAIPAGTYTIQLTYSPKFRRRLPLLLRVPFFEGVRIHAGNTNKDTEGCILVGRNRAVGKVLDSRKTEQALMDVLEKVNEQIIITIK